MPSMWQVRIGLSRPEDVRLEHLHAVVSSWLDPHDGAGHHDHTRPFAIAPLNAGPGSDVTLSISLLDDEASARRRLVLAADRAVDSGIELGRQHATVVPHGQHSAQCVASESWTALAHAAEVREEVRISFLTPTAFRHGSDWDPLPSPYLVFGHLRRRWQEFAPALAPEINFREAGLRASHIDGHSETLTVRKRAAVGFVGEVTYRVRPEPTAQRALHQLALAAPYCGVGAGTTFGLGVCDVA